MLNQGYKFAGFLMVFILAGVYVFILGDSGLLMRRTLNAKKIVLAGELDNLQAEKERLASLYEFYRSGGMQEMDLLNAGYLAGGDRVLFLEGIDFEKTPPPAGFMPEPAVAGRLRIIWMIFSALCVLLYLYFTAGLKKSVGKTDG